MLQKVKTYLGADFCTDHNVLAINIAMKLKWIQKFKREPKQNLEEPKISAIAQLYAVKTENSFSV